MIALEVFVNGRRVALAGAEDLNVLSAIVTAVGKLGPKASGTRAYSKRYGLSLNVGGLTGRKNKTPNDFVDWVRLRKLKLGDEIRVCIRQVEMADPRKYVRSEHSDRFEREEFKWIKSRYSELRTKYDRPSTKKPPQRRHRKRYTKKT